VLKRRIYVLGNVLRSDFYELLNVLRSCDLSAHAITNPQKSQELPREKCRDPHINTGRIFESCHNILIDVK